MIEVLNKFLGGSLTRFLSKRSYGIVREKKDDYLNNFFLPEKVVDDPWSNAFKRNSFVGYMYDLQEESVEE